MGRRLHFTLLLCSIPTAVLARAPPSPWFGGGGGGSGGAAHYLWTFSSQASSSSSSSSSSGAAPRPLTATSTTLAALEFNETARGGSTRALDLEKKRAKQQQRQQEKEQPGSMTTPTTSATAKHVSTSPSNDEHAKDDDTQADSKKKNRSKSKRGRIRAFIQYLKDRKSHQKIAKQLKNRNATNLRRKLLHATFGATFAALNHWIPRDTFVPAMAALSSATLLMELLRYRRGFGWMNDILHHVLGSSLRKHEMEGKFTGSFYFFTGVTLTAYLAPTAAVSTLAILQLALADPSASYFGRQTRHVYWSRIENGLGGLGRNKGWLGFIGGALFCVPFNLRVLSLARLAAKNGGGAVNATPLTTSWSTLAAASLLLGLAGALADLAVPTPALVLPKKILGLRVPPFHLDDNMVVPMFSAYAAQWVLEHVLQWPLRQGDAVVQLAPFLIL